MTTPLALLVLCCTHLAAIVISSFTGASRLSDVSSAVLPGAIAFIAMREVMPDLISVAVLLALVISSCSYLLPQVRGGSHKGQ